MKTQEELKVVLECLEAHLEDFAQHGSDFQKGMICGAIDALQWALGQKTLTNEFFSHYADLQLDVSRKAKKKIIGKDYFGA